MPGGFFKITLLRSGIGLPYKVRGTLDALGLKKRMATVFHPVNPDIAGHIMKVKELVAVTQVDHRMSRRQMHNLRKPDPGFYVEKAVPR